MSIILDIEGDGCRGVTENSIYFSMVIHREVKYGANDDIHLGLLYLRPHNPDVRLQLMPEDIEGGAATH